MFVLIIQVEHRQTAFLLSSEFSCCHCSRLGCRVLHNPAGLCIMLHDIVSFSATDDSQKNVRPTCDLANGLSVGAKADYCSSLT